MDASAPAPAAPPIVMRNCTMIAVPAFGGCEDAVGVVDDEVAAAAPSRRTCGSQASSAATGECSLDAYAPPSFSLGSQIQPYRDVDDDCDGHQHGCVGQRTW